MPKNWAFDQFCELSAFKSSPPFPLDKDAYSGRDTGFKKFDAVPVKTDSQIKEENVRAKAGIARNQYIYNVMEPLGYLDKIMDKGVEYEKEIILGTVMSPEGTIEISTKISTSLERSTNKIYSINVTIGNDGKLEQTCKNQIMEITSHLSDSAIEGADKFGAIIEDIALKVKSGNIDFEMNNVLANSVEFSIVFNSSDLLPEEDEEWKVSVALNFKMTLNSNSGLEFKVAEFTKEHAKEILGVIVAIGVVVVFAGGLFLVIQFLLGGGALLIQQVAQQV